MALIDVHVHIHAVDEKKVDLILQKIQTLTDSIMDKFADVKQEFENMKVAIAEEKQQIANGFQSLEEKVAALETNIADGGTQEERAALIADIKNETVGIKDIIKDLPPPEETGGTAEA